MSYELYKVMHVFSVLIFVALGAMAIVKDNLPKAIKITIGTFSVLILVGGMGLLARIGVSHGSGLPTWVMVKMVIWFVLAALFGYISARGTEKKMGFSLLSAALFLVAVVLAIYKNF